MASGVQGHLVGDGHGGQQVNCPLLRAKDHSVRTSLVTGVVNVTAMTSSARNALSRCGSAPRRAASRIA